MTLRKLVDFDGQQMKEPTKNRIWLGGDQAYTIGHFRSLSSTLWLMGVREVGPLSEQVFNDIVTNFYDNHPDGANDVEMLGVTWWKAAENTEATDIPAVATDYIEVNGQLFGRIDDDAYAPDWWQKRMKPDES